MKTWVSVCRRPELLSQPFKTEMNFSSYRTVNAFLIGYKNNSCNFIQRKSSLGSETYTQHTNANGKQNEEKFNVETGRT